MQRDRGYKVHPHGRFEHDASDLNLGSLRLIYESSLRIRYNWRHSSDIITQQLGSTAFINRPIQALQVKTNT